MVMTTFLVRQNSFGEITTVEGRPWGRGGGREDLFAHLSRHTRFDFGWAKLRRS